MKNKIVITGLIFFIFVLASGFCFATEGESENSQMKDLGNEFTESIEKTKDSAENVVNGTKNTINSAANTVKNTTNNMVNSAKNMTGNYSATKTSTETDTVAGTFDSTTWMWVMLAVIGVVIIASVWLYITQSGGND